MGFCGIFAAVAEGVPIMLNETRDNMSELASFGIVEDVGVYICWTFRMFGLVCGLFKVCNEIAMNVFVGPTLLPVDPSNLLSKHQTVVRFSFYRSVYFPSDFYVSPDALSSWCSNF